MTSTVTHKREDTSVRDKTYLETQGISTLVQDFFNDLFQREELPANPFPELVRRFRIAENARGLFRSLQEDAKESDGIQNKIARSPELSGVTYIQGAHGIWGMPHMLRMVDPVHLDAMAAVLSANEFGLRADTHPINRHDAGSHVSLWVALTGPAALAGKLFSEFWADVQLAVSVELLARSFEVAVDLFAETVLAEAMQCQGSDQFLLRRIVIDVPLRHEGVNVKRRTAWTPHQLNDSPDTFLSEIKTSLPSRPSVTMTYLFLSPAGAQRVIGGPIMSIERSYTMHYRHGTKAQVSLSNWPFQSLYGGVMLSGAEAKQYGSIFQTQGFSFAVHGVAKAEEYLAEDVERAREVGDILDMHAALLPLALLSGVNEGDAQSAGRAAIDVSRVTKSDATRHRSLRNLCDSIVFIVELLIEWVEGSRPIVGTGKLSPVDGDSEAGKNNDNASPKTRHRSLKELFQAWMRTAHRLFWGWRCDILRYLDEDRHSDVAIVKNTARKWLEDISSTTQMGLRLPMLRWHEQGHTIAHGKGAFLVATATLRERLSSLSAWLRCLDLSLAWDASKVCDRVHVRHLQIQQNSKNEIAPPGGWSNLPGFQLPANRGQGQASHSFLPTTSGLLQLQRSWLDESVAAAHIRDMEAAEKAKKGKPRRQRKSSAASTAAAVEAAVANGVRYVPAPLAPDSDRGPKGLSVRKAVFDTLREDLVPEAFAHEITLMKYAANNKVNESLHDCISELLTSVLMPNPFPVLTDALAVSSMSHTLRRTVDAEKSIPPVSPNLSRSGGYEDSEVFASRGEQKGAIVYGSEPALRDVDVERVLSIFGVLPPVAGWVLDELGDDCTHVDLGIFECAQRHGSYTRQAVPSDLTVMLACACDFELDSDETPIEVFAQCAVYCATATHEKSDMLVTGLTACGRFEGSYAPPDKGETGGEVFSLQDVLHEPEEVIEELVYLKPEEIVLDGFLPVPIPSGGAVLAPISIRFIFMLESRDDSGCSEASAATMFYKCVFSTAKAADNVAARHAELAQGFDLRRAHIERTRQRVLEKVGNKDYLEAYRLIHHLLCLGSIMSLDEIAPITPEPEVDSSHGEYNAFFRKREWSAPLARKAASADSIMEVTTALKRMFQGPAGRFGHARSLLEVLSHLLREGAMQKAMAPRERRLIEEHAKYSVPYLLDTFAQQPLARFEGAIESIKLRARLLLDRVAEMAKYEDLSGVAAPERWADITHEQAVDLSAAVTSMLEIVQLASEADTHRCCPEMDRVFKHIQAITKRAGEKPAGEVKRDGRRVSAAASREPP